MKKGAFGSGGFGAFSSSTASLSYVAPPPDLSSLPQDVIVPFKNLLKRDSTTKSKALEEILACVKKSDEPVDDSVIDLVKSAKKRIEKTLPKLVGPWVAGTFDKDKGVARAALAVSAHILDSDQKKAKFWIAFQGKLLEYANEAIRETVDSLSDERTTSKEDMEAKYYRVLGSSMAMIQHLLPTIKDDQYPDELKRFFDADTLWTLAASDDASVRRAFYQLVASYLDNKPSLLEPKLKDVGRALVAESPKKDQRGSAVDLLRALISVTKRFPKVWGSKSPLDRLRPLVQKGSQGGSDEYWTELDQLLVVLSTSSPDYAATTSAFLKSMRTAITSREERRQNTASAWACYLNTVDRFTASSTPSPEFLQENLYPLTQEYLLPSDKTSAWASAQPPHLLKAWKIVPYTTSEEVRSSAKEEWQKLGDDFATDLSNSLPEVSPDYEKSQWELAAIGERWFNLVEGFLRGAPSQQTFDGDSDLPSLVASTSSKLLDSAQDLLYRRNYKPFCAAAVLKAAFTKVPGLCAKSDLIKKIFPLGDQEAFEKIVVSRSFPYLASCLAAVTQDQPDFSDQVWAKLIDAALSRGFPSGAPIVKDLVSVPLPQAVAQKNESLQKFIVEAWHDFAQEEPSSPVVAQLCKASISHSILDGSAIQSLASSFAQDVDVPGKYDPEFKALELLLRSNSALFGDAPVDLFMKLLSLEETSDSEKASKVAAIRSLIQKQYGADKLWLEVIRRSLADAEPSSLDINTLVRHAKDMLRSDPSLSITSSFGGAYFLATEGKGSTPTTQKRDRQGRSIPARMAVYTTQLLRDVEVEKLPVDLLELIFLTGVLANDDLTVMKENGLWSLHATEETRTERSDEIQSFLGLGTTLLARVAGASTAWKDGDLNGNSLAETLIQSLLQKAVDLSFKSLYASKALTELLQALVSVHGYPVGVKCDEWFNKLGVMKATPQTVFAAIAFLIGLDEGLSSSRAVANLYNRLVSDIVGCFPSSPKTLYNMVLLTVCLSVYPPAKTPVEQRKLVFALKQFSTWVQTSDEMTFGLTAEVCKGIHRILPNVAQVYGPYWREAIDYCLLLWEKARSDTPQRWPAYVLPSIRLISAMETLEDANDDLVEALEETALDRSKALIRLLELPHDVVNTARRILDETLCRVVQKIPLKHLTSEEDLLSNLYGLLSSGSRDVQTAAFSLLHRALPAKQEEEVLETLLEEKAAKLPDELLALVQSVPALEKYTDEELAVFPVDIRAYLLGWHLVFDAYNQAPLQVRKQYTEYLKADNSLNTLLELMFDILGHSAGQALNLDKSTFSVEHIRSYDITQSDEGSPERDMQWLLVHLFYLSLKFLPGLVKSWYLDLRSKQTKIALDSWMAKYYAPLLISDALDEVNDWASSQEAPQEDEKELRVRVNRMAKEISAGYEIDEEFASIAIKIPAGYPLESVEVIGENRVAVNEKKWQSWVRATQGVITFANGSITDGLAAFRRNIIGALKGHTECPICYAVVSADKKLPDKRCGTCNNLFHRLCLYKWFQNSNKNTCPLCRNPIDYLGSSTRRGGGD
ncbi:unnamed protein product [Sordaria macrospora k-hell]|uniref:E3 ubiquitin-protein ligase listerin n=1 Tax=Sordaria macrospora (strain ATCC MYA-333 / DSM 997 / K(L3346) / K-hell) TaxID=771870 RepID=F7W226_SORMK|nr:uncharacterized protein SMAC_04659 [Sordaria macrospora k-hell]CCC11676.1 unnamed protein product [Sordaria macrospora k-hell]